MSTSEVLILSPLQKWKWDDFGNGSSAFPHTPKQAAYRFGRRGGWPKCQHVIEGKANLPRHTPMYKQWMCMNPRVEGSTRCVFHAVMHCPGCEEDVPLVEWTSDKRTRSGFKSECDRCRS